MQLLAATVQPENVHLLFPTNAFVLLPNAIRRLQRLLIMDVPTALVQEENVYLFVTLLVLPKAKIPKALNGVALELAALNADGPKTLVALTLNVYAVPLVKHATAMGDVVPVPVLNPGQDTAV